MSAPVKTHYIKIGFSVFFLLVSSDCVLALATEGGMPPPVISLPANANQDKLSEPEQSPLQRKESGENPLMVSTLKPFEKGLFIKSLHAAKFPQPPQSLPAEGPFQSFLLNTLIPNEAIYFTGDVGLDLISGMPYDHVRFRLGERLLSEVGNYTAASKLSLSIPYLMKIIQQKPLFANTPLKPGQAKSLLKRALKTLLKFTDRYPEYGGFLPWVDIKPNGSITPASTKVPSLDNGQMTWALAAAEAAFDQSKDPELTEIAQLAGRILAAQDYRKFFDPTKGLLHGTIQQNPMTGEWAGDRTYYLNDMCEGTLAVLWGILNGQIPESAWNLIPIPLSDYTSSEAETLTTLTGFRSSFHEHWALAFLPFMDSELAPLYQNYLFIQADHARSRQMPGFTSTAYDPQGVYRQMGIQAIASDKVDRDDVAVFFATAMGMLIDPVTGASWLKKFYGLKDIQSPYGSPESVGKDGVADIFTADGKGMTLLAASGGVIEETTQYLKRHMVPGTKISMYVKLLELLTSKYKQMLKERGARPIHFPNSPAPQAPQKLFEIHVRPLTDPGPLFDIIGHLQSGHLHGKNVRSVGQKTLEQDVFPDTPFTFDFEIAPYFAYFDQWAFRGTYTDQPVKISEMHTLNLIVPAHGDSVTYEVALKSDDITLATAVVDTSLPVMLSEDGCWKKFSFVIEPTPEAGYKPFNYLSVSIHDPRYMLGRGESRQRTGTVHIEKLWLAKGTPDYVAKLPAPKSEGEFEFIRYWRPVHGNLFAGQSTDLSSWRIESGAGWKGGYLPYTNLLKFNYAYLKLRNVQDGCNCFHVEFKHEGNQLMRSKIPVQLAPGNEWHVYEIKIPEGIKKTFNYFAISDPNAPFEIGSMLLTKNPLDQNGLIKIEAADHGRKQLACFRQACR
jgi:hypothetical protein